MTEVGAPTEQEVQRFWTKVEKRPSGCWMWLGAVDRDGYGFFRAARRQQKAHRVSYQIATGQQAGDLFVCHTCDTPGCVNPGHLFLGTNDDNVRDKCAKGRVPKGVDNGRAVLSEADVQAIRKAVADGQSHAALARRFAVSPGLIWHIAKGLIWKHLEVT
jgi:hypothetical protein